MTDIGHLAHIQRPATQLPVTAYFDESLYRQELHRLFDNGPGYRGHRLMVPEPGDYRTLVAEQEGRVLVEPVDILVQAFLLDDKDAAAQCEDAIKHRRIQRAEGQCHPFDAILRDRTRQAGTQAPRFVLHVLLAPTVTPQQHKK